MKQRNSDSFGFTLIELLIVISIIVIISSIALTFLISAKNRASDAKIRSNLAQVQRSAEIFFTEYDNYGEEVPVSGGSQGVNTICPGNTGTMGNGINMFSDTESGMDTFTGQGSLDNYPPNIQSSDRRCFSSIDHYAVLVLLSDGNYWCVDSRGNTLSRADFSLDPREPSCQ
jgi:prepilin-type N-terminal cleavage/methylation domain-containing protein